MQKEKKAQTDSAHAFFPGLARLRPLIPKLFTKVTHQLHFVVFFATHPYIYAPSALALQCESRPSAEGKPGQGGLESGTRLSSSSLLQVLQPGTQCVSTTQVWRAARGSATPCVWLQSPDWGARPSRPGQKPPLWDECGTASLSSPLLSAPGW